MQKKGKTQKDDSTFKKKNARGRPCKVLDTSTPIAVQLQGQMYNNALSAKDLYRWADSADSSGAQGLKGVAEVAVQGYKAGNLARDMRKALRQADYNGPDFYEVMLSFGKFPMILPHEALSYLLGEQSIDMLEAEEAKKLHALKVRRCTSLGMDPSKCTALTLWGDGVPVSKRRAILIFCLSIAGDRSGPRLPLIIIPQLRGLKGEARDEQFRDVQLLLEVILWSTRCLLVGKWPGKRPEHSCKGTPSLMM